MGREPERPSVRWRGAALVGAAVLGALVALSGSEAHAQAALATVPAGGSCTFGTGPNNTLTATFSPALTNTNGGLSSISGGSSCTTTVGTLTGAFNLSFSGFWTCAAGQAAGAGQVAWSGSLPNHPSVAAVAVASGSSIELFIYDLSNRFAAWASLVWSSPTAEAQCASGSGLASTPLAGNLVFVSA